MFEVQTQFFDVLKVNFVSDLKAKYYITQAYKNEGEVYTPWKLKFLQTKYIEHFLLSW